eukprot:g16596.t1
MGPRGHFPRGFRRTLSSAGLGVEVGVALGADLDHIGCRSGANRVPKGFPWETDTERASPRDRNRFRTIDRTHIGAHISTHIGASISDGPASDKSYQHGATQPPLVKESPEPRLEPSTKYTYLGCYKDGTGSVRAMKFGDDYTFDNIEKCARFCGGMMNVPGSNVYNGGKNASDAPYVYFALQVGIQCFCSNDKQKTLGQGKMLQSTEQFDGSKTRKQCAVCPDNQDKGLSCGSDWSNSVYETPYPDNRQYCPGGQTPRRIVQWQDCPPDDDEDNENDAHMIVEDARPPSLRPAEPQPTPHPSTPTVQVVKEVDGTTKEKDCLSDFC